MEPRVSVLLPFRNAAATLEQALDSVLDQVVPGGAEVLAIDDDSTDASADIAGRLAGRHRHLRRLRGEGRGLVAALTTGLAASRGELIARMDADDVSLPGRLGAQVAMLDRHPGLGLAATRVEAFPTDAVAGGMRRYVAWQNQLVDPRDHRNALFVESPVCHPSVMIRRHALDAVGAWRDGPFPEDYDLWLRLDAADWQLAKVPEVFLRWRHVAGRATFSDPRYGKERFLAVKAPHLTRRVREQQRPLVIWGAGRTGKLLARALEQEGLRPRAFIDIDPKKVGGTARGAPVHAAEWLQPGRDTVVVAVSAWGARDQVRRHLDKAGFREGNHYLCAA